MKLLLVAAAAASLTTAGIFAGFGLATGGADAPQCGLTTEGSGLFKQQVYTCTLKTISARPFLIRLPSIDILCETIAANNASNFPDSFTCDRLSTDTALGLPRCIDGTLGSWSTTVSARRFEIDSPEGCKMYGKLPGQFKITSGSTSHSYFRNP